MSSLGYKDEQSLQSQPQKFARTGTNEVPIVPRQMTWKDLRQVRGDQVEFDTVQIKKKLKPRNFDAKSGVFTSELPINHDSSFSDTKSEANLEAFPIRAHAIVSTGGLDTVRVINYDERKRVAMMHSIGSSEGQNACQNSM